MTSDKQPITLFKKRLGRTSIVVIWATDGGWWVYDKPQESAIKIHLSFGFQRADEKDGMVARSFTAGKLIVIWGRKVS